MVTTYEERQAELMNQTFGDESPEEEEITDPKGEEEVEEPAEPEEPKGEEEEPENLQDPQDPEEPEEPTEPEVSAEEELESLLMDGSEEEEEPEEPADPKEPQEPADNSLDLTDDQFDEISADATKFKEYVTKVRDSALTQAREEFKQELANAKEEILRNIPDVVQKSTQRMQSVRSLTQEFYENNPQLKEKRGYVKDMVATVSSQNPDMTAKDVLNEVASRAKRDLGISEKAAEREKERGNPKFAGGGGRRVPSKDTDTRSKQQKLLDETFGSN